MNDRFKFRVWAKPHEPTATEGYYVDDADYMVMTPDGEVKIEYYCDNGYDGYTESFEQDEIIIEQCTGLKDKNGKLIYEGDIVEVTNLTKTYSLKTPVIWEKNIGAFMVWGNKEKSFGNYIGALMEEDEDGVVPYTVEIIGNIHIDKNLLEQSKDKGD